MDPELENLPTDYAGGLDFTVSKTSKGGYADYSTSKWSRKESALTQDEAAAIEKHGLFNLSDFLPKKPSAQELAIIKEMFEASVDGQPYDTERFGSYYRPRGVSAPAGTAAPAPQSVAQAAPVAQAALSGLAAPVVETTVDAPFEADEVAVSAPTAPIATPAGGGQRAEDILAMIRNRQKTS
jgi:hypothetical protein